MDQLSFADTEYAAKKRKTRREKFLEQLDSLIPWTQLERKLGAHYPKAGGRGGQPYPLSTMLRVHIMQICYSLSDPAMEDALYEIESMRRFARLKLTGRIPDETTILNFRHWLEEHHLGHAMLETVNRYLAQNGLALKSGTIIDATIIEAPSSTKNKLNQRDPEMHQTRKGNQWHFGMKMHIGVDDTFGTIHTVVTTPANTHDLVVADKLLHGQESLIWADSGYRGIENRPEHENRQATFFIAERPSVRRTFDKDSLDERVENAKASVRAKVEHPFRYIKRQFGYAKVIYKGLAKNTNRLTALAAITNLLICRQMLPT